MINLKESCDMQLTVDVNIEQLIQLIKNLPEKQKAKIKSELFETSSQGVNQEKVDFQKLLLSGPSMSDSQYSEYLENRKRMNQWRTN